METNKENYDFKLPIWSEFTLDGYLDKLKEYFEIGLKNADRVSLIPNPKFSDVITSFEENDEKMSVHLIMLDHLKSVSLNDYPGIEEVSEEATQLRSAYGSDMSFHVGLYKSFIKVKDSSEFKLLSPEEKYLILRDIKDFENNGIALSSDKQIKLKSLKEKISSLQDQYGINATKATDAFTLNIVDRERFSGVPEAVISICENKAKEVGFEGYSIPLQANIVATIFEYAEDRNLREELWMVHAKRASSEGMHDIKYDNSPIIVKLLSLRDEAAKILGYKNHADYSISNKMAGAVGVDGVDKFLKTLSSASLPKSKIDNNELLSYAKEHFQIENVSPWDTSFIVTKMQKEKFGIDTESLRDYFPVKKVFDGLASLINRLFGYTLREKEVSVWHESVKFYELIDENQNVIGGLYADLYARPGKRGGAWMESLFSHLDHDGVYQKPVAFLCSNFRKAELLSESYLTHDNIVELFHEMGHALHHLFTKAKYQSSSMMVVEWDAVELPSQLFEDWAWKKDLLKSISCHKDNALVIPDETIEQLLKKRKWRAGTFNGLQFTFATFDWNIHKSKYLSYGDVLNDYWKTLKDCVALPTNTSQRRINTFTHLFAGGYDAGYFSYSWANGLVADTVAYFNEVGSAGERDLAMLYKREILEYGASRPMTESFKAFRGRDMDPTKLIPFLGLD